MSHPSRALLTAVALSVSALAATSPARACDSASCSLLTRGDNDLIAPRGFKLGITFGYSHYGHALEGSREVDSVLRPRIVLEEGFIIRDYHRDLRGYDRALQIDAIYGLNRKLNLVAAVPFATWHSHDTAHGAAEQRFGASGLGDVLLGVRSTLGVRGLTGGVSIKLPTGDSTIGGEFGGGILDPMLQPGTGAFAAVALAQYSRRTRALGLSLSLAGSYQWNTENDLEYRFGDQAIFTAAVSRAVVGRLTASLQAKVIVMGRNSFAGLEVPSTGSRHVYITPGLRYETAKALAFYGYIGMVPSSHVNEGQLAPTAAFVTGLSKLF